MTNNKIEIIGITGIPIIKLGDAVEEIIAKKILEELPDINSQDIIVIAHTILSRAKGYVADLKKIEPTPLALAIAKSYDKDPRHVQVVLDQAKLIKLQRGIMITENYYSHVAANAGVDRSNAEPGTVILLPRDPDELAEQVGKKIGKILGFEPRIIISDTLGRTLRKGAINVAIGTYNVFSIKTEIGKKDLFDYVLRVTQIAIGDELASAAEIIMGESDEAIPVVIIRGVGSYYGEGKGKDLCREENNRMFK